MSRLMESSDDSSDNNFSENDENNILNAGMNEVSKLSKTTNVRKIKTDNCRAESVFKNKNKTAEADVTNESKEEENNKIYSHEILNKDHLSYLVANLRGYNSKKPVFDAILNSSQFKLLGLTETHQYDDRKPEHKDYDFFHKNREKVGSKGGIAIGYLKEFGSSIVKVFEGSEGNELLMVQVNGYEKPIIFGVYYGAQENTAGEAKIRRDLIEMFSEIYKYDQLDYEVIMVGDMNLHIGNRLLPGNDDKVSKGGEFFMSMLEDSNFDLVNRLGEGDPRTHLDVSSGTSRTLDLVITNRIKKQTRFEVDHEKRVTAYTIRTRGGEVVRNYCDHLALIGEMEVEAVQKKKRGVKVIQFNTSKPGGKERFRELTDASVPELMEIIKSSENMNVMMWRIDQLLDRIKREAFGIRTVTKKRQERVHDEGLMLLRTETLAKQVGEMNRIRIEFNVSTGYIFLIISQPRPR